MLERVDVHAVANLIDAGADRARGVLENVNLVRVERLGMHPDERGLKLRAGRGRIRFADEHVAAAEVDFVLERDGDRIARNGGFGFVFEGDDGLDFAS